MNKILLFLLLFLSVTAFAQFPGPPGEAGTTAIKKDSTCFIAWATGGTIQKGYLDINDTNATAEGSNKPTFGLLEYAFGPAQGTITNVVSLGDSGVVTLTFDHLIQNGNGWDFAVFENGFMDGYMELAHVEVSSDGGTFFRFPSTSDISTDEQYGNFTVGDCREVDNLAGKYRNGFGTPFDLDDVPDNLLLNKNAVTHIRIVDAVGSLGAGGSVDQNGNKINDPYPTPFASGGFDLDGVGIINGILSLKKNQLNAKIWPNPATDNVSIELQGKAEIRILSVSGQEVAAFTHVDHSEISFAEFNLQSGIYLVEIVSGDLKGVERLVIR